MTETTPGKVKRKSVAKKVAKERDPNAPPRVLKPLRERNFISRERTEATLQALGVSLDDFYARMASNSSLRGSVAPEVMAAYYAFVADGDAERFIAAAGIKKAQLNPTIGRCARQAIQDRRNAATVVQPQPSAADLVLPASESPTPEDEESDGAPDYILTAN